MAKRKKTKRVKGPCGGRVKAQSGGSVVPKALQDLMISFLKQDAARRTGTAGDPVGAALEDRKREGELMAGLLGPLAPAATVPVAGAAALWEGIKATGADEFLAGPFKKTEATSPPSIDNILSLLQGFTTKATGQTKSRHTPKEPTAATGIRGKKGGRVKAQLGGRQMTEADIASQRGGIGTPLVRSGRPIPAPPPPGGGLPGLLPGQYPGQPGGPFPTSGQMQTGSTTGTHEGYTQNIADTGVLDNLVTQMARHQAGGGRDVSALRGFDPFTGQLGTTQDELLRTGLRTDVGGATEAARIRAGQEFDTASDSINELLASKGLLSSSARSEAIARERAKMGERIGAAGLEAEIAASEAAAGRRAGGVGMGLTGTGQQLAATQGAGQLDLSRTGQELAGQQSAAQGAARSADLTRRTETGGSTAGTSQSAGTQFGFPGGGMIPGRPGGGFSPTGALGASRVGPPRAPVGTNLDVGVHARQPGGMGSRSLFGAQGGQVPDLKGFEQWLEQQGISTAKAFGPSMAQELDPGARRQQAIERAVANLGGLEEAFRLFSDPELQQAAKAEGRRRRAAAAHTPQMTSGMGDSDITDLITGFNNLRTLGKAVRLKPNAEASEFWQVSSTETGEPIDVYGAANRYQRPVSKTLTQNALPEEEGAGGASPMDIKGSMRGRQGFQGGGPVNPPNTVPMNRPTANLTDLAIAHPTSAGDPRRSFFEDGGPTGGEVPGIDTGVDKVPAMLRSEELVVTPELVQDIEAVQSPDQAMAVIETLKVLAQKPLEYDPEEGEHVAQEGGFMPNKEFELPDVFGNFMEALARISGTSQVPPVQIQPDTPGTIGQALMGDPAAMQSVDEFLLKATGSPKESLLTPTAQPEPEGPPAPTPMQRALPIDVAALRDPEFMPFIGPGRAPEAEVVPGFGGAAPTLRATGGEGVGVMEPTQFKGDLQGTLSVMGTPSLSEDQMQLKRIEDAKRRQSLIQSAMNADPVGGPEKFMRLQNALNNANRQVEQLVNEVVAKEKNRISERYAAAQEVQAAASLSNATANQLSAEAQKATAYATVAEKLQQAAAADPRAAMVIEMFAKMNPQGERGAQQAEAVMKIMLERLGIPIKENGFFRQLFGAPPFELDAEGIPPQDFAAPFGKDVTPEIEALIGLHAGV